VNKDDIVQQVMNELRAQKGAQATKSTLAAAPDAPDAPPVCCSGNGEGCNLTEFVGSVALGNTIGMVIANLDASLHKALGIPDRFRSVGILTARDGNGPHAMAGDEAVKACNVELVMYEMSNDSKGSGGQGCMMLFGAEEVSDARRAIEIALKSLEWSFGGRIANENGYIDCQYTARASHVLANHMNAELGKAWGMVKGCPAGIGVLMADAALKAADVEIQAYGSSNTGVNVINTNEFVIHITGDSGAVRQAVQIGREVGMKLLRALGGEPTPCGKEYL